MRHFPLGQQWVLLALCLLVLGFLANAVYRPFFHPPSETLQTEIAIEVLGDVPRPGIHVFPKPPELHEAIRVAGGLQGSILPTTESHEAVLETGTSLFVTRTSQGQADVTVRRMEARKLLVFSIPLDLNRVSADDLCLIPGIGEVLAREVIAYRERKGRFQSVEELKHVKGIGERKWEGFKTYFRVSP